MSRHRRGILALTQSPRTLSVGIAVVILPGPVFAGVVGSGLISLAPPQQSVKVALDLPVLEIGGAGLQMIGDYSARVQPHEQFDLSRLGMRLTQALGQGQSLDAQILFSPHLGVLDSTAPGRTPSFTSLQGSGTLKSKFNVGGFHLDAGYTIVGKDFAGEADVTPAGTTIARASLTGDVFRGAALDAGIKDQTDAPGFSLREDHLKLSLTAPGGGSVALSHTDLDTKKGTTASNTATNAVEVHEKAGPASLDAGAARTSNGSTPEKQDTHAALTVTARGGPTITASHTASGPTTGADASSSSANDLTLQQKLGQVTLDTDIKRSMPGLSPEKQDVHAAITLTTGRGTTITTSHTETGAVGVADPAQSTVNDLHMERKIGQVTLKAGMVEKDDKAGDTTARDISLEAGPFGQAHAKVSRDSSDLGVTLKAGKILSIDGAYTQNPGAGGATAPSIQRSFGLHVALGILDVGGKYGETASTPSQRVTLLRQLDVSLAFAPQSQLFSSYQSNSQGLPDGGLFLYRLGLSRKVGDIFNLSMTGEVKAGKDGIEGIRDGWKDSSQAKVSLGAHW